jgi:hypothetical protein
MAKKDEPTIIIQNQNTQNNSGCLSGCGNLIGIFFAIGLIGAVAGEYGVIVYSIGGMIFGAWAGMKIDNQLSGSSLTVQEKMDEMNSWDWQKWGDLEAQQKTTIYWFAGGLIIGLLGGISIGSAS